MSSLDHFQAPLPADMEKQRAELADLIRRNTLDDGSYATAVGSLFMSRHSKSHDFAPGWPNRPCASWPVDARKFGWRTNTSITTR